MSNIIYKDEFDLNYKDPDLEYCNFCGYQFSALETYYYISDVTGDTIHICEECLPKIYQAVKAYIIDKKDIDK